MSQNLKQNTVFDQNKVSISISRNGFEFDYLSDAWLLNRNITVKLEFLKYFKQPLRDCIREALLYYAETYSASYTKSVIDILVFYQKKTGCSEFCVEGFISLRNSIRKDLLYRVSHIRGFIRQMRCVPEEQLLTMNEAALALGLDVYAYGDLSNPDIMKKMEKSRAQFLKRKGIALENFQVNLRDLNRIIRDNLPENFPYIPFKTGGGNIKVKWSESLYANFSNCFSSQKPTIYTELYIPTINTLNEDLAPTKKKDKKTRKVLRVFSIFQRWGYGDLALTSHQLRHMLDTMAAVNGMDGEMRAKWAMRSNPSHNRYYDHTTAEEYGADFIEMSEAEDARLYKKELSLEIKKVHVQIATPRNIQELNTKVALTAHTTEFGMCIKSYLSEPCDKYRDCLNCNELVCEKGDDDKCERIRQRLKHEKRLLKMDEKAVNDGVQGAIQWYKRRKLTTERGKELITMLENPNIPDGSLIKLANIEDVSLLDRAMNANGKKRLPRIENFRRIKSQIKEANKVASIAVDEMIGGDSEDDALIELFDEIDFKV